MVKQNYTYGDSMVRVSRTFATAIIFAAICLLASFAAVPAYADNIASGTDWTFADDGTVTITSDAGMTDWVTWKGSNYGQLENVTGAVIGNAVTTVDAGAFSSCNNLASVTFEAISSVATIGVLAFGYTGLQTIEIPASVTSIGTGAFTVTPLTGGFTVAAGNAIYSVSAGGALLEMAGSDIILHTFPLGKTGSYTVESGITKIGENAFYNTRLSSVTIPAAITDIGTTAFGGSYILKAVTFEGSMPPAGLSANTFLYTDLTYILVPATAGAVYKFVFGTTLESIVVEKGPDNVTVSTGAELKEALGKPYPTTITLGADVTLDEKAAMNASHTLTVPSGKTLIISGGDNIINIGSNTLSINGGGTVTVNNTYNGFYRSDSNMTPVLNLENITVNLESTGNNDINVNTVNVNNGATVNLNSATGGNLIRIGDGWTLTVNTGGVINILDFYGSGISNSGTVHINGGTVSVGAGTADNWGISNSSTASLLKITSGTLTGTDGGAIYLSGKFDTYMSGSKVEGAVGIFADRGVTLTNNGQIEVGIASDPASANGLTEGLYFWNGSAFERLANPVEITSIVLNITAPVAGATFSTTPTIGGTGYNWSTINYTTTSDGAPFDWGSTFAANTDYTATVVLFSLTGYQFGTIPTANVTGTNGVVQSATIDGGYLTVVVNYPAGVGTTTGTMAIGGTTVSDLTQSAGGTGWMWTATSATLLLDNAYTGEAIAVNCQPTDNIRLVYSGDVSVGSSAASAIFCEGNLEISENGAGGTLTIAFTSADALHCAIEVNGSLAISSGNITIDGTAVYLARLMLDGVSAVTEVTEITSPASGYSVSGRFTNASGELYFLLPAGSQTVTLTAGGTTYSGTVTVATDHSTVATLNEFVPIPTYGVSIATFENGTVSTAQADYMENETVTLTLSGITAGYELSSIAAHKTGDENTAVSLTGSGKNNGATYTFDMPAYGVTVTATFDKAQATLDAEAVATAKTAIEAAAYTVTEATANTEDQLKAWLVVQINSLIAPTGITVADGDITLNIFTEASGGNDGNFDFTAALSKGSATGSAGNNGIITATPVYTITVEASENGSVTADMVSTTAGETVTLTITPATGYEPDAVTAHKTGDTNTSVPLSGSDATRTFTMPGYDVTVTATFKKTQETLDAEAVATAKTAIEAGAYTVAQTTANTEAQIKAWLATRVNDRIASTGITVSDGDITLSNFTAASDGNDGSFDFSISLTKGSATGSADKNGTITATPVFTVTIGIAENGSVATDKTSTTAGETVTLTITPAEGYELEAITAHKSGDVNTSVSLSGNGTTRTFTMPGYDVTVTASFKKTQETLDAEAVATATTAIENRSYTVAQATANTQTDVRTWLVTQINDLIVSTGISVSAGDITVSNFTAASNGTDGSFNFSVSLTKGSATGSAGKDGIISATPVYAVTIGIVENGSVAADKTSTTAGETVTLTITPATGYELVSITAHKTGDANTSVSLSGSDATRTFTMPGYDVTVTATFGKTQEQWDKEAVEAAKAAIEGGTYRVAQATANDAATVRTWLVNTLNLLFKQSHHVQFRSDGTLIDAEVSITDITPAVAGTEESPAGTDGAFGFTVSLSKGASSATADVPNGVIVATPHVSTPVKRIELLLSGALTLRILNTGNMPTGELALALSGAHADAFTLPSSTLAGLPIGGEADITLTPRTGLTPGTYTATLTVSGEALTPVSQDITYTILPTGTETPQPTPLKAYLQNGTLHISGLAPGKPWRLYSIAGALVYQSIAQSDEGYVTLSVRGIYIVKSGKDTIKVVY